MKSRSGKVSARQIPFSIALVVAGLIAMVAESASASPATWTTGHKKVLIIPVRFTDQAGPSDDPGPGGYLSGWGGVADGTTTTDISAFFARQSYGKTTLEFTLLPEIDLGVSYTDYNLNLPGTSYSKFTLWYESGSFADDARAKAKQAGLATADPALYDSANYDLDIIACGFIPGQSTGSAGNSYGKGVFALNYKVLSHEICHNFGLQHGNGISRATFYSPIKSGTYFNAVYGDVFDLMGDKDTQSIPMQADNEANAYWKYQMGWLPADRIIDLSASGTYRIYAFDQGAIDVGKSYAMKFARDSDHTYWYDFRQSATNAYPNWSDNGLEVHFGGESIIGTAGHTILLDMTPGSRGPNYETYSTMHDAPLAIGRTYSDAEVNLHITPIKKGGTVPESLDVVANFGPFPGNSAPTISIAPLAPAINVNMAQLFTATASDPDGDQLAYYWEFDDRYQPGGVSSGGTNADSRLAVQGSHAWSRNGVYLVRCTATDMKGHVATASAEVTVSGGSAGGLTISGVVKDELGNPLRGAIVNNYKPSNPNAVTYGAWNFGASNETADDGKYMMQLPPIGTNAYYMTAMYQGYTFTCSIPGGAVSVVATNVTNVDFTRVRASRTISGAIVVAGRSYDPATDGPMTISDGAQSVLATLGHWQMDEADGALVTISATAADPSYTVLTHFFPNPYRVVDDYNLLHLDVKIPGKMPETGFVTSGSGSDDTVGTVYIPVTMTLPAGYVSWGLDQTIYYWIDDSSTAEYGVDYKTTGGRKTFTGGVAPTPQLIPLTVIHDSIPKSKTVVIKIKAASSIANLGPITAYTYTITNGAPTFTATPTIGPTTTPTPSPTSGCGRQYGDFDSTGFTDLSDFLYLLDWWTLVAPLGPPVIDLNDFLNLLDFWQTSHPC